MPSTWLDMLSSLSSVIVTNWGHFIYLNDGERVSFDRESESGISGNVDYSEPVALSRLDVNSSTHDLRSPVVSANTVNKASIRYLFDIFILENVVSCGENLQVRRFLRGIPLPFPGQPGRMMSLRKITEIVAYIVIPIRQCDNRRSIVDVVQIQMWVTRIYHRNSMESLSVSIWNPGWSKIGTVYDERSGIYNERVS